MDLAGGFVHDFERSNEGVGVGVIKADVIAGTGAAIEPQPGA